MSALLSVEELSVTFRGLREPVPVLDRVSFEVESGEILGIVGESGSGKSVTSLAIMGLLGSQGRVSGGRVVFDGTELTALPEAEMRSRRGARPPPLAMIFQEPGTSLNPVLPVGFQIAEVLTEHLGLSDRAARDRAADLMDRVGIPAARARLGDYPHEMSGGMKQRIMIAMALACRPRLLIADEPTTALDVTIQAQILELITELRRDLGMAVLLITHDMGVIAETADRVIVMYAGRVVEAAPAEALFADPRHPYTRLLLRSDSFGAGEAENPADDRRDDPRARADAAGLPLPSALPDRGGPVPERDAGAGPAGSWSDGAVLAARRSRPPPGGGGLCMTVPARKPHPEVATASPLLRLEGLSRDFALSRPGLGRRGKTLRAVDQVSLDVIEGETLGVVGESGCGKTTLGRMIVQLIRPSAGRILWRGEDVAQASAGRIRLLRRELQIVFQDPYSSLNPRMRVRDSSPSPWRTSAIPDETSPSAWRG